MLVGRLDRPWLAGSVTHASDLRSPSLDLSNAELTHSRAVIKKPGFEYLEISLEISNTFLANQLRSIDFSQN